MSTLNEVELLKASAVTKIQQDLEDAVAEDRQAVSDDRQAVDAAAEQVETLRQATADDRSAVAGDLVQTGQDRAAAEAARAAAESAALTLGATAYATRAALFATTGTAGARGYVYADATETHNGLYFWTGSEWQKDALDLTSRLTDEVQTRSALLESVISTGALSQFRDAVGVLYAFFDQIGHLRLAGMGGQSVQEFADQMRAGAASNRRDIRALENEPRGAQFDPKINLSRTESSDGRTIEFTDEFGKKYLAHLGGKPLQDHINDANARLVAAGPSIDSVNRTSSPAIRKMTDAEDHVYEVMDELGNWYIPRLGGRSVQDHILQLRDKFAELPNNAVKKMLERRRVYDAVHDFGVPNDGLTDAFPAAQAAIDQLSSQSNLLGPSVLYFPQGVYRLERYIYPRDNVTIIMAGWGKSRFLPIGIQSGFLRTGSTVFSRANFIDVEIDGSEQFFEGGARVGTKGMFFQRWSDCQFVRCYIHDTWATGLGIDFSPGGSWIVDGRYEGCGRGSTIGQPGSSGIGIGTGIYDKEPLIISHNICRNNKNFGIFLERQHQGAHIHVSRQNIIADNICSGNGWGIGEVGGGGSIIDSNQCNDNLRHGIYCYSGTIAVGPHGGPHPGVETIFSSNVCDGNAQNGLCYDANRSVGFAGIYTNGNSFIRNGEAGMRFIGNAQVVTPDFAIKGDTVKGNGGSGIVMSSGLFADFDIIQTRIMDNAGAAIQLNATINGGRIFGATLRSTTAIGTQTAGIIGSGQLNNFDISECVQSGHATPNALTGTLTNVTYGRNPGFTFT